MKRIGIIVSSPTTVKAFLTDQIEALSRSYQVCLVLNLEKGDSLPDLNAKVEVVAAPIVRNISVLRDLHAFDLPRCAVLAHEIRRHPLGNA